MREEWERKKEGKGAKGAGKFAKICTEERVSAKMRLIVCSNQVCDLLSAVCVWMRARVSMCTRACGNDSNRMCGCLSACVHACVRVCMLVCAGFFRDFVVCVEPGSMLPREMHCRQRTCLRVLERYSVALSQHHLTLVCASEARRAPVTPY